MLNLLRAVLLTVLMALPGPASSNMLLTGAGSVGGGTPFAISLTAQNSSTAGTASYTFTAQSTGSADPTRITCVLVGDAINAVTLNSVTIGGTLASQVSGAAANSTGGSFSDAWCLSNASGTTADIVLTFSAAQSRVAIAVYRIVGTGSSVAAGAHNQVASGATSLTQAASIPSGGGAIAIMTIHSATAAPTLTNLTNDTGSIVFGSSTSAAGNNVSSSGSTTMGGSWTGASDAALSIVTFNP